MKLLFPCHPLKPRLPDPDYEVEVIAARQAGFECEFYDLELVRGGDAKGACRSVPAAAEGESILHRGWMMSKELYALLQSELARKGYRPVVTPEQYAEAHYLPNAYPRLVEHTPESVWMNGHDLDEAWSLYQRLSDAPAMVKDFVKSAKHRWNEACFIPAHTTRARFDEIIHAFLEARGTYFNKGIVIRRYHEIVILDGDSSGQPLHEEYRLFFWRGDLLAATPAARGSGPTSKWTAVAQKFQSPFISMDVARQTNGAWIIIEVGDGGVSGLPPTIDPQQFYSALWNRSQT